MSDRARRAKAKETSRRRLRKAVTARASGSSATKKRLMRVVKEAVLVLPGRSAALGGGIIPCGITLSQQSGSTPYHQDIATYGGTKYVGYISHVFSFGGALPVTLTSNPAGHSFSGMLTVCNLNWICTNGQPRSYVVSVSGELKTSSEPDELNYTYTIDLFCGGILTCSEKGTFSGTRYSGAGDSLAGDFYGKQSWMVTCCPARHVL